MSHTIADKKKLIARVRRIRGQMEAVERALEAEAGCTEILQLVASVRGAVGGLSAELLEAHIRNHLLDADVAAEREKGGLELIEIVRSYMK